MITKENICTILQEMQKGLGNIFKWWRSAEEENSTMSVLMILLLFIIVDWKYAVTVRMTHLC